MCDVEASTLRRFKPELSCCDTQKETCKRMPEFRRDMNFDERTAAGV